MDISRFGEFVILAQSRTFLDASELLFMSQSTLSKHIAGMERELGCTLIDRRQRNVTLTARGTALLPYAQKIATLQHRYIAALQSDIDEPLERITVGSIPIMAPYGITDAVVDFQQANPSYSIELFEGEGDELKKMLLREEIDLAFIRDDSASEPEFRKVPFATDCLVAVLPPDHPLAMCGSVSIDDLIDENFLMLPQGSFVSRLALSLCSAAGFSPRVTFTGKRAENIISLVARGAGISLLMRKPSESLAENKVVLVDIEPSATSEVKLYLKRNRTQPKAVMSFIGYLPYRELLQSAR
ncbi:MAG: LysR family transcriptional regulator [Coriobacteriia bacterium]|nr:LysR family transcriptional regulator [Coriobacteriia bacterium]